MSWLFWARQYRQNDLIDETGTRTDRPAGVAHDRMRFHPVCRGHFARHVRTCLGPGIPSGESSTRRFAMPIARCLDRAKTCGRDCWTKYEMRITRRVQLSGRNIQLIRLISDVSSLERSFGRNTQLTSNRGGLRYWNRVAFFYAGDIRVGVFLGHDLIYVGSKASTITVPGLWI